MSGSRYHNLRKLRDGDVGKCSNYTDCTICGRTYNIALRIHDQCAICQGENKIGVGTVALDATEKIATRIIDQMLKNVFLLNELQKDYSKNVIEIIRQSKEAIFASQWNYEMNLVIRTLDNFTIPTTRKIEAMSGILSEIRYKQDALVNNVASETTFDVGIDQSLSIAYSKIGLHIEQMISELKEAIEKEEKLTN